MEIKLYDKGKHNEPYCGNPYMPQAPARVLAIGPSGSGKTTAVLNMILEPNRIGYDNLYCYCKSPDEELFEMLSKRQQKIAKLSQALGMPVGRFVLASSLNNLITYEQLPKGEKNVILIDDFLANRGAISSEKVSDLYFRSRKRGGTAFFMSQSFFRTPEDIRTNSNCYILCRGCASGKRNGLSDIANTIAQGVDLETFKQMYETCTTYVMNKNEIKKAGHKKVPEKIMGFLYVDTLTTNPKLRFRCGFDRDPLNPDIILPI